MPTSSDWEAEAASLPTGGQALFMSTQDPGEGVTVVRSVKYWKVEVMAGSRAWPSHRTGLHSVQQIQRSLNGAGAPP